MPTPGSHSYDVRRTRLRGKLDNEGIPDQHADAASNEILQQENTAVSPGLRTDRARGPYGERTPGGGDPGAVIELRSPAFNDHTMIPARCSRPGGNVSPALEWSDVPPETAELALLCEDPDAPRGAFIHWLVTGIAPSTRAVAEGEEPSGTSWPNDWGGPGYGGPQPPIGDDPHRYFFRLFALAEPLEVPPDADPHDIRRLLDEHLASGTLVGLFAR